MIFKISSLTPALFHGKAVIKKITRLFNTLKHLQFMQLVFFILRRKFTAARVNYTGTPELRVSVAIGEPLTANGLYQPDGSFVFLNISKNLSAAINNTDVKALASVSVDDTQWCPDDVPRLWRYNLHYFDYLRDPNCSNSAATALLNSWVANNSQGSQPGWEPFTASLRIVNWVFYFLRNPQAATPTLLQSLYTQVLWLEKNDERHILANHYFENLKAFTFAGVFFAGADAERWLAKGTKGLREQLLEQTLADGGHYERTPQYHALMLENYVDIVNLAAHNPVLFEQQKNSDFVALFKSHSAAALRFYRGILFPDGLLPLFNDSAFGIAPSFDALQAYWQRLGGESIESVTSELIDYKESGLFGYRQGDDMVIIDAGDIGPSYQPGHTHCDMLSFELMFNGQRVVIDSGVLEYEPGPMRHYVRSTRAHNTVSIDGAEQSEVWGEFRVARRAKVLSAQINNTVSGCLFVGAYQGFHQAGVGLQHRRELAVETSADQAIAAITVTDNIQARKAGTTEHLVESFIHFHPALEVADEQGVIKLLLDDRAIAEVIIGNSASYHFEQGYYCPEFGIKRDNTRLVLTQTARLPCQFLYTIRKI